MTEPCKPRENKTRGKATPETVEQMATRLWDEENITMAKGYRPRMIKLLIRCLRVSLP